MDESRQRIGDHERDSAVAALREHHAQGRIDAQEYEARSVRVRQARTRAELDPVFADLPAPHPIALPQRAAEAGVQRAGGLLPEPYAAWVMSLIPFLALVLFFTTHLWLWWLIIPVAGLVIYGPDGRHRDRRRYH
jgi:Domain of unknown function (DUF1707)